MALEAIGLKTSIWNNNLRSLFLLGAYPFILGGMIWITTLLAGMVMAPYGYDINERTQFGASFAGNIVIAWFPAILTVVALWFIIAFFFHGRMIRKLAHAKSLSRAEEPELYSLLENLCISRGLPVPKLQVIETHARNAFASGIDNKSYCITVTRGLLRTLTKDEVEAVLAHELSHIMNRDVRLLIISVIFTGMIGFMAQIFWSNLRFNMIMGGRRWRNDPRILIIMIIIGVILWLGYLATLFTRFALSRRREYMADAGAVELTKNPAAMMRALMRITGRDKIPEATDDIALMCIENTRSFMGLFATHPPVEERIEAIARYTNTPVPDPRNLMPAAKERRFENPDNAAGADWLTKQRKNRRNPWQQ